MSGVLIVGASRGLGASLAHVYAAKGRQVFATSRSKDKSGISQDVHLIPEIDVCSEVAGAKLASSLKDHGAKFDILIITAGYFQTETFEKPDWGNEVKM